MRHPADVVVIGGGLVGLACARELRHRGARVEVLETVRTGSGASFAGAGLLAPISDWESAKPVIGILRAARDRWIDWLERVIAESGIEVESDRGGALLLALDAAEARELETEVEIARTAGEEVAEMTLSEARELVPSLPPDLVRVVHLPGEHRVDNVGACAALAEACRRAGVSIREGFAVRRIGPTPAGVRVEGLVEHVEGDFAVIAAGAWSGRLEGIEPLPVRPVRGQMLRLEGAEWPWRGAVRGRHDYAVRRGPAGLLVGATVEESGFDDRPTLEGIAGLLAFARRAFPGLGDAPLSSIWAGLRPGSPDGLPLIGPHGDERIVAACGHFRNGILLAPWTGAVVAGLILDGTPVPGDGAFDPGRFRGR